MSLIPTFVGQIRVRQIETMDEWVAGKSWLLDNCPYIDDAGNWDDATFNIAYSSNTAINDYSPNA